MHYSDSNNTRPHMYSFCEFRIYLQISLFIKYQCINRGKKGSHLWMLFNWNSRIHFTKEFFVFLGKNKKISFFPFFVEIFKKKKPNTFILTMYKWFEKNFFAHVRNNAHTMNASYIFFIHLNRIRSNSELLEMEKNTKNRDK